MHNGGTAKRYTIKIKIMEMEIDRNIEKKQVLFKELNNKININHIIIVLNKATKS